MPQFQSKPNPAYSSQQPSEYGAPQGPAHYAPMPQQGYWPVQGPQAMVYQPMGPVMYIVKPPRGFAIAGMVLGILSLVVLGGILSLPLAIVGLSLSVVGKRKQQGPMATAGIVCSVIALGIILLRIIFTILGVAALLNL